MTCFGNSRNLILDKLPEKTLLWFSYNAAHSQLSPVVQRDLGRGKKKKERSMKKMRGTTWEPETVFLKVEMVL